MLDMRVTMSQKLMMVYNICVPALGCNVILVVVNDEPRVEVMETTVCREGGTLHYEVLYLIIVYN